MLTKREYLNEPQNIHITEFYAVFKRNIVATIYNDTDLKNIFFNFIPFF